MPKGFAGKSETNRTGGLSGFINVPYQPGTNPIMAHLNTSYYHVK